MLEVQVVEPRLQITEWPWDGDLPDDKGAGIDIVKRLRILLLDKILEDTDVLGFCNFYREGVTWIIAEHDTVEFERMGA